MASANYNLSLTDEWLFHYGEFRKKPKASGGEYQISSKTGGALKHLEDFENIENWRSVNLPHDWLTEIAVDQTQDATYGCKKRESAWYKKTFTIAEDTIDSANLVFDGVLGNSTVYVNGVIAARNFSGYNRFSVEIGDYLVPNGKNEIAVYVDAHRHEGWWYEGAGIYRPVNIFFRNAAHILNDECFIKTCGNSVIADIALSSSGELKATLTDNNGNEIAEKTVDVVNKTQISFEISNPLLWSPEKPNLYTFTARLYSNCSVIDEASFTVGFRDIKWVENSGMYLNGKKYPIKGVCVHQDHSGLGAAVCEDVEMYRVKRLKSLGANAIRTAHHAPSRSLLDICDALGMLVMVENRHFDLSNDTFDQLDALVKLSRNHPCVFLYSLFNEEPWQDGNRGKRIAEKLRERVLQSDNTRAVMGAQNDAACVAGNASEALDIIGINYYLSHYEECHKLYPQKVILATENSPTFATRGVYETSTELQIFEDNGTKYPSDFSEALWETMECVEKYHYVAGCFVWSGFDHRGEPNPYSYPSVSSHWGYLDSCGFDKNSANWLRAYYIEEPFIAFASFAVEHTEEVMVFTNCNRVELFADGVSLGVKEPQNRKAKWQVPQNAQNFMAVSFKNGEKIVASKSKWGKKAKLKVTNVNPKGEDGEIRILNICVTDQNEIPILSENGIISVEGTVIAVGNGNPNAHFRDNANQFPLFNGMAQIITRKNSHITISYDGVNAVEFCGN